MSCDNNKNRDYQGNDGFRGSHANQNPERRDLTDEWPQCVRKFENDSFTRRYLSPSLGIARFSLFRGTSLQPSAIKRRLQASGSVQR
jgi:hypothetical protein